jgi:hypothetical protein
MIANGLRYGDIVERHLRDGNQFVDYFDCSDARVASHDNTNDTMLISFYFLRSAARMFQVILCCLTVSRRYIK